MLQSWAGDSHAIDGDWGFAWPSGKSASSHCAEPELAASFLERKGGRWRGETSLARRPNPVKLVEMLKARGRGPLKSGIVATSKRFGSMGPYGSLHRKNLSHHGIGLVASGGQDPYYQQPYDYGYHGYDYGYGDSYGDPYVDPTAGAAGDAELPVGPDEAAQPVAVADAAVPMPAMPPMPEGDVEDALKAEQDAEFSEQCMARCHAWDPLATAKPEDLQHASLVMLQRLARPERRLTPALRHASAAVDAAGRSMERWVRKRQDLARELPKLRKITMECKNLQDQRDAEKMEEDLQALRAETQGAKEKAEAKRQEAEEAQESMVMQDVGHMQGKANRWAMEQAMQEQDQKEAVANSQVKQAVNVYNQQGADLQQRQMVEAQKEMAKMASSSLEIKDVPKDATGAALATSHLAPMAETVGLEGSDGALEQPAQHHQHHQHHHHYGDDWSGQCDEGGCWDQYGGYWDHIHGGYYDEDGRYWEEGWSGYWDPDGTFYKKVDNVEAVAEKKSWKEWFEKCGQIRIPPSIISTRRAASEAYWDFDRSLALAEKAVDEALTSARIKGE